MCASLRGMMSAKTFGSFIFCLMRTDFFPKLFLEKELWTWVYVLIA